MKITWGLKSTAGDFLTGTVALWWLINNSFHDIVDFLGVAASLATVAVAYFEWRATQQTPAARPPTERRVTPRRRRRMRHRTKACARNS